MWIRALILGGSATVFCLGAAVAAETPTEKVAAASDKAAPSATDEELELAALLRKAREQGFTVVDKEGETRLCRTSKTIGSRLKSKTECYTPEQWEKMSADTQAEFRENTRKQLNKSEGG